MDKVKFNGKTYNARHGGPFDRGSADSWYSRGVRPHYFVGATYQTQEVKCRQGSKAWEEYMAGYEYNELHGGKKDWG